MYCDVRIGGIEKWYAVAPADAEMLIPNTLRDCTCFLCVKKADGSYSFGGTAFLVSYKQSEYGREWYYLVTARHCIDRALSKFKNIHVRVNTKEGGSEYIQLPASGWYGLGHESGSDVAVLPWNPPSANFALDPIGLQSAAHRNNFEANAIGIGNEVLAIGLLSLHSGTSRNIPIVRHGIISAVPEEPLYENGKPFNAFLVEVQSIGGLSGSPVFVYVPKSQLLAEFKNSKTRDAMRERYPAGFLYLLGAVRGHFEVKIDKWMPKDTEIHAGIATVTPSQEILDLVMNDPELRERRQKDIDAEAKEKASAEVLDSSFDTTPPAPFTKEDFENALKRASRRVQPSPPDEGKSKT